MNSPRLAFAFLALLACSRSTEDAGIVLNVDTVVTADRAAIDQIAVTVDGKRREVFPAPPLPGSLGIVTSPGEKIVNVEGLSRTFLRGTWTGRIVATKGAVIVRDVHLAHVDYSDVDAGTQAADSSTGRWLGVDANVDVAYSGLPDSGLALIDLAGKGGGTDSASSIAGGTSGAGGTNGAGGTSGTGRTVVAIPPAVVYGRGGVESAGGVTGAGGMMGLGGTLIGTGGTLTGTGGTLSGTGGTAVATAPFSGAYSVVSHFQVPATVAAPGPIGDTLRLVHGLATDPGTAILNFAESAGVPALATLRAVLPDALESRLTGWMNSYLRNSTIGGSARFDQIAGLDETIRSLLLDWNLESKLALPVGTAGTHSPLLLSFASPAGPVRVPLDATAPVTSGVGVTATVSWPSGPDADASVTIGDHSMGIPFGHYALQAFNRILLAQYGAANLGAFLSNTVGCSGMASSVANQCVSILCVGHQADLLAICEGGIGEAAKQIEAQILGLDFKTIRFQSGAAIAVGSTPLVPEGATSLQNGIWTSTIDLGNGAEAANATFSASAAP